MLELAILGFLAEGPLPGHELRRRVTQLTGYTPAGQRRQPLSGDQPPDQGGLDRAAP